MEDKYSGTLPHPNLSDAINNNIAKSEIDGGVWLNMPEPWAKDAHREAIEKGNVLATGKTLLVQTKNTLYRIEKRGENDFALMKAFPKGMTDEQLIYFFRETQKVRNDWKDATDSGIRSRRCELVRLGFVSEVGTGKTAAGRPCGVWGIAVSPESEIERARR